MLESPVRQGSFVDVGCGSGVLAIVAAALGFDPVRALDYDPGAVTATEENAQRNGVTLHTELFDLRRNQVPGGDLVVANVLAGPLVAWAAHQEHVPRQLIVSGILTAEADRVAAAFADRGRAVTNRRDRGEWTALALAESA
jgi:ribosomal protein L11 methyltransferase